jgi:hypothetical protein
MATLDELLPGKQKFAPTIQLVRCGLGTDENFPNIVSDLIALEGLKILDLFANFLSNKHVPELCRLIENHPSLEALHLGATQFSLDSLQALAAANASRSIRILVPNRWGNMQSVETVVAEKMARLSKPAVAQEPEPTVSLTA